MRIALYDIDSKIPNFALMKLSSHFKSQGDEVSLQRNLQAVEADQYFASVVFHTKKSQKRIQQLQQLYGDQITIGGSGIDLQTTLADDVECCFPDYALYNHTHYALGFLTRGCNKRCHFCVVPPKEGALNPNAATFDDFVPEGQKNVMLLDNNLLVSPNANSLLEQMIQQEYRINFSQTLDIQYLNDDNYPLLKQVYSMNSRFTRRMIYFSCNNRKTADLFEKKREYIKGFGHNQVTVVIMYGFNTRLSEDFAILKRMASLGVISFVQEYQPTVGGSPSRTPEDYFDMDLDEVSAFRFRSNGQNGEKFFRYLNRLYQQQYGRYYLPMLQATYRYNNKPRLQYYLDRPHLFSRKMYHHE
ncbi:MAG: hypothetical protein HN382_06140 [Gammaproteobacteria bacterium]|jgi:hypothetical protein|nr:hypothetical protein [Gammaproteobacteria bacterium]MBT4080148.1 hypothetical protein [Gammaproteobacteria bacterium]MBT4331307.1 hypothetical protein [Gammaproteobacteria bacterium]MBT5746328.1 hypothetical protein [Gammaproteobacteria bacterium]MBT6478077.1 hypothetical protein [Gammaproteobacteria bacterium]